MGTLSIWARNLGLQAKFLVSHSLQGKNSHALRRITIAPRAARNCHRIAIAIPSLLPLGGVERTRLALASEFLARGYQVDFVIGDEQTACHQFIPQGANTIVLGAKRVRNVVQQFARYIRQRRPAAIIASMWPFTSACIVANELAGTGSRILVSDHNPLSIQYRSWGLLHRIFMRLSLALTYRFADQRVGVSSGVADDVAKLSGISRERFQVVHNPVYLPQAMQRMTPAEIEAAWGGFEGKRILAVGSLKAQKNYPLLLDAFAKVHSQIDARLMILGTGALEQQIRQHSKSLGLTGHAILAGHTDDLRTYYQSADVLVVSSNYEGFGNVIVEALSCGLPVVSTNCPTGPAEILEGGKWGELVPVGDPDALAGAIMRTLNNVRDPQPLKDRAAEFSPGKIADRYLRILFPPADLGLEAWPSRSFIVPQ